MVDRELLELAAKAAGITGTFETGVIWYKNPFGDCAGFNPLNDDGDALRLAVKLRLMVDASCQPALILCAGPGGIGLEESARANPCAATRRAIVRAAAEIGRNTAKGDGGGV